MDFENALELLKKVKQYIEKVGTERTCSSN